GLAVMHQALERGHLGLTDPEHALVPGVGGRGQLADEIEQLVLDLPEHLVEPAMVLALLEAFLVERPDEPDDRIQLVDGPVGLDARRILRHAPAADQTGIALVPQTGVDARDADGHGRLRWCADVGILLDPDNGAPRLAEVTTPGPARGYDSWASATLLRLDEEVSAAVLGPAGFVVIGADRPLFAVGDDAHAVLRDALADQIVHCRLRPTLAEREVVLVGAALVAVALDQHEHGRVALQPRRVGVECLGVARPDVVLVEVEVDVLQLGGRPEGAGLRPRRRRDGSGPRPG